MNLIRDGKVIPLRQYLGEPEELQKGKRLVENVTPLHKVEHPLVKLIRRVWR